uniref:PB1-like domain-containing protein n=1 Tax=Oryza punctata TaxID=4537 RepID=A0A0E0LTK6_ORYPU
MAEDTWTLILQLNGATPENEYVQKEMDKDILCFFNLVGLVEDCGFTAMDYMYYKWREGSGTATLVGIQSDNDVTRMLAEFESEKKVRLCVMKEKAGVDSRVSITPLKVSGEMPRSESNKYNEGKYSDTSE